MAGVKKKKEGEAKKKDKTKKLKELGQEEDVDGVVTLGEGPGVGPGI